MIRKELLWARLMNFYFSLLFLSMHFSYYHNSGLGDSRGTALAVFRPHTYVRDGCLITVASSLEETLSTALSLTRNLPLHPVS
jgi:hypothetical protein